MMSLRGLEPRVNLIQMSDLLPIISNVACRPSVKDILQSLCTLAWFYVQHYFCRNAIFELKNRTVKEILKMLKDIDALSKHFLDESVKISKKHYANTFQTQGALLRLQQKY